MPGPAGPRPGQHPSFLHPRPRPSHTGTVPTPAAALTTNTTIAAHWQAIARNGKSKGSKSYLALATVKLVTVPDPRPARCEQARARLACWQAGLLSCPGLPVLLACRACRRAGPAGVPGLRLLACCRARAGRACWRAGPAVVPGLSCWRSRPGVLACRACCRAIE
jgi:hypothetical protein